MNGKRNTTLAVVGILVVLVAILSIVIRLWLAVDGGKAEARASFDELTTAFGSPASVGGLADRDRRLGLVNIYASDRRLLAVWVADRDRGILWRLPDRSPYLPSSENFSRDVRVTAPKLVTTLLRSDWSGDGRRIEIDALYVTVSQERAFVIFRDAAIGLGAWLLVALFVILVGGSDGERVTWRPGAARTGTGDARTGTGDARTGTGDARTTPDDVRTAVGGARTSPEAETEVEADFEPEMEVEPEAEMALEDFEVPELDTESSDTADLYSPSSGLGYESWLVERLDGELSRAAAIEQDLSILIMSLDGLDRESPEYAPIAQSLREFFSFRDLAFERGEEGFSVILPNLDAAHALRMAEEFHKKLTIQVRGREDGGEQRVLPLYMGLSSRAGRLVEARRLIEEAGLALERAREEDDSRIVAFKPDPDKYRLWLASVGNY